MTPANLVLLLPGSLPDHPPLKMPGLDSDLLSWISNILAVA